MSIPAPMPIGPVELTNMILHGLSTFAALVQAPLAMKSMNRGLSTEEITVIESETEIDASSTPILRLIPDDMLDERKWILEKGI